MQYGTFFDRWAIPNKTTDICTMTRQVLIGTFFSIPGLILLFSMIAGLAGLPIFFLVIGLTLNMWIMDFWLSLLVLLCIAVATYIVFYIKENWSISNTMEHTETTKELRDFVATNYKSFKEKTCILIEMD